jgi:uncharacterized membrane-anchored protein
MKGDFTSMNTELSEQAREARRAYKREWNKNNSEKVKKHTARYWEKKALLLAEQKADKTNLDNIQNGSEQ